MITPPVTISGTTPSQSSNNRNVEGLTVGIGAIVGTFSPFARLSETTTPDTTEAATTAINPRTTVASTPIDAPITAFERPAITPVPPAAAAAPEAAAAAVAAALDAACTAMFCITD
jgi:hypothetical protein